MKPQPLTGDELVAFGQSLLTRSALAEMAVFAACLALSWALVRGLRGPQPVRGSVWFGRHLVDGVLFPVLALLLALLARRLLDPWMPLAAFRLIVPLLVSLVVVRVTVRVLRVAFPDSRFVRIVERSVSWLVWIGLVLWVTGVLPLVMDELGGLRWQLGDNEVSARSLLEGVVSAIVVMVLALWISAALEARLLRGVGANLSLRMMLANLLRAGLLFIGLMFALSAAGIDLTALGVLGGAVGVGIGFGLQKLASNYVSGFVILAERSLRIGDTVKVDGFEGRITDIKTRYTVIRALNGRESIVPNELLITQRVENASFTDTQVLEKTVVQVAYGTDAPALLPQLEAVVRGIDRVLADPAPSVRLTAFADSGLELTIFFWIGDPQNGTANVRSDVNLALLRRLSELGVEIPFPQRVVRTI